MLAVEWEGKIGHVGVNKILRPKLREPEDAIVRITSSAICGSDLHIYHGLLGNKGTPHGIGHEGVGIVEQVGSAVDFFKKGDRVIINAFAEDGHLLPKPSMLPLGDAIAIGIGTEFGSEDGLQSKISFFQTSLIVFVRTYKDLQLRGVFFEASIYLTRTSQRNSPVSHGRIRPLQKYHTAWMTRSGFLWQTSSLRAGRR